MKRMLSIIATLILFVIAQFFGDIGSAPYAFADVSSPIYIGSLGYISASTKGVSGGSVITFTTTDGIAKAAEYYQAEVTVVIHVDGGSTITAHAILYDKTTTNYDNGYLMIADQNVSSWVQALGGNLSYVTHHMKTLSATDTLGQTITLVNLDTIVVDSGAIYESQTPTTTVSGNKINATYNVQTSLPPNVSVSPKSQFVTAGNKETLNVNVQDDTYHTGVHMDAISVTTPGGTTEWLTSTGTWVAGASSPQSSDYLSYSGGDQDPYSGSVPTFKLWTDSVSFPTTDATPTGTYNVKVWVQDALDRPAQPATTTFKVTPPAGLSLTASPTSLPAGQKSQLLATINGISLSNLGDYSVEISDQQANDTLGGQNSKTVSGVSVASAIAESSTPRTESYIALLLDAQGNIVKESNSVSVTWTQQVASSGGPSITVTPTGNIGEPSGTPILVSYTTTGWQSGDYVNIKPQRKKGDIQSPWYNSTDSNSNDSYTEVENPTDGNSADIQYIAQLMNSSGTVIATATSGYFGWYSQPPIPSISMAVSPSANLTTGQMANIAYEAKNYSSGDYVDVTSTGNGQNEWTASHDTQFSVDSSTETETPYNGNTVTVHYTAVLYNSSGKQLAQAGLTVTWTSPKPSISITGNPVTMMPGQASYVTYKTQTMPSVDTVQIIGQGGTDAWNASGLTQTTGVYREIENPSVGQSIPVNYTANILDQNGNIVSQSTTSIKWVNAWSGTIDLKASPQDLPTDSATTLTATTSQSVPSGYTVVIMDETTGQEIDTGTTSTTTTQYTSFSAATDTFVAYITDGFEQIGNNSNQVTVQWSGLSLSASPLTVTVGQSSKLSVQGTNVPSGDYLVILNQSTGQEIGASQSTPYSVSIAENSAQSDTFVAYISSNNGTSGQWAQSNSVTVSWFGVTLTGNPQWLPINHDTTLQASAANLPTGYEVDIKDQTSGQVVATGQPGQTGLNLLQKRSTPQTDTFVADVLKPGNPSIPSLTVPRNSTATSVSGALPMTVGDNAESEVGHNGYLYVIESPRNPADWNNGDSNVVDIYNLSNNTLVDSYWAPQAGSITYGDGYVYISCFSHGLYEINTKTKSYTHIFNSSNDWVLGSTVDPQTGEVYVDSAADIYYMGYPATEGGYVYGFVNGKLKDTINLYAQTGLTAPEAIGYWNGSLYVWCQGIAVSNQSTGFMSAGSAVINVATDKATVLSTGLNYYPPQINWSRNTQGYVYDTSREKLTYTVRSDYDYPLLAGYSNTDNPVEYFGTLYTPSPTANYFPTWAFNSMPTYVPTSIFTATAQASSDGYEAIWTSGANPEKNGTAFFQSNFTTTQTKSVTFSLPHVNDYAQVYVDGQPVMQYGNDGGNGNGSPSTTSTTLSLPAGKHQVIVEAVNNNQYQGITNTSAGFALTVTSGGQTLLTTANPTQWTTTGYVTSLPSGWFSGSVGSWTFSEAVMQETASPAIYQQQTFTVTNTAQNVAFESKPVSITWYQYKISLIASPTTLPIKAPTTLTVAVGSGTPTGMQLQTYDQTTNQVVGTSGTGATSYSAQWTEGSPTTDTFVARLINPSNGSIVTTSNTVSVTWNQAPLTLSSALVTHTATWLQNLQSYNAYYSQHNPSLVRSTGDFWAGEQLLFRVAPSISNIASAHVTISGLQFSPYAPSGWQTMFEPSLQIPLTYNASTGELEGQTDASWSKWFPYLQNGTYAVKFWVKSSDDQIATLSTQFAINGRWVGPNSNDRYHDDQEW